MHRRQFFRDAAAMGLAASAWAMGRAASMPEEVDLEALKPFRITRIRGFRHNCPRPKMVGKNSHLDVHGDSTGDDVLWIETSEGVDGIGVGRFDEAGARQMLGQTLDRFWSPGVGVVSPLGRSDHAMYDLIGKALNVPAWSLFGGDGPEWVPVYDGSLYFADLLPTYEKQGVGRLLDEADAGLKAGHRAFKIKVGRGYKWMPREDGFRRDVEVVQAIRKQVGPEVRLMVDANNGFTREEAIRWLETVGDDFEFVEEMFPEAVDDDRTLQEFLKQKGWKSKVADGESARDLEHFDPYLGSGTLDVMQPDIRAFGLTLQWAMSRRIAERNPKAWLAPHNWGSHLGLPMQLILARGVSNVLMCEQDTSRSDLFDASPWEFREGKVRVPDLPGCGLVVNDRVLREKYAPQARMVELS